MLCTTVSGSGGIHGWLPGVWGGPVGLPTRFRGVSLVWPSLCSCMERSNNHGGGGVALVKGGVR